MCIRDRFTVLRQEMFAVDDFRIVRPVIFCISHVIAQFVQMCIRDRGYIAGQAVYDKIEGTAKAHLNDVMYELVVRGSTRPDN